VKEPSTYVAQRVYPEALPQHYAGPPQPEMFGGEQTGPDLRDYIRVLHRHVRLILSLFLGALLVTTLVVLTMTPIYTAKSTILIERQSPQVLNIQALVSETGNSDEHDYYKTQQQILKSRSLAAEVIRDTGLDRNPDFTGKSGNRGFFGAMLAQVKSTLDGLYRGSADRGSASSEPFGVDPALIDEYLSLLTIKPEIGTKLFQVGFSLPNAALASRVANAHVHSYIQRGMEIHSQASEAARQFLEKKLVELKERVEKSEAALNDYRRERGIVSFTLDDKGTIMNQRLTQLNKALTKAETDRIEFQAQSQLIKQHDYAGLPAVVNSPLIQQLKAQRDVIAGQYASLAARFKPDYPPLMELKAKLDDTNAQIAGEIQHVVQGVEGNYQAALTREGDLRNQVEAEKTKALAMNDASLQDAVLAREVDANRELYKSVLERMKEIGVAGDVPTSNVSIIDRATPPEHPSSPEKLLDMAAASTVALFLGIAIAFLLDHLDDGLHNPEEAEIYLGLASLGTVPDFLTLENPEDAAVTALPVGSSPALLEESSDANGKEIVVQKNRFSAAGESYRAIRTAILLSRAAEPPKTILFASGTKSEGKTVTAVNIAMAFAQMGGRVLLIDGDLRRARCHEVLGVHNLIGLTEVLVGQKQASDVIRVLGANGLSFLSAGSVPPNPTELLASRRMQEVLAELTSKYDSVIIDSPPVMPVSDSVVLSRMVDGVVVVVGPRTPKQLVRHSCARLGQVGAKVLGVVLNRVNLRSPDYYHYHRYYAYEDYYKPNGTVSPG
jgi:succinoglycan biosynthesis transport protein ExoP